MAIVQYYVAYSKETIPDEVSEGRRYELEADNNYSADDDDFESCLYDCAYDWLDNHDGWENNWPLLFMLWIGDLYIGMFEVECEYVPDFSSSQVG
ncbi:hypothetical protein Xind_03956 [Xenorhabdus indica]|nr:hypothetical protein [Xenorhabdus indica]